MLQTKTINAKCLGILKDLMLEKVLSNFFLAGGTALALRIGHRKSIDLDFFTNNLFKPDEIISHLQTKFKIEVNAKHLNTLSINCEGIKLDFLRHNYPILMSYDIRDGVRLASIADIAAMKLNAINNRGSKKDFVDLFYLLKKHPLQKLFEWLEMKYGAHMKMMVHKSLIYFEDAEDEPMPYLFEKIEWETIKQKLKKVATEL